MPYLVSGSLATTLRRSLQHSFRLPVGKRSRLFLPIGVAHHLGYVVIDERSVEAGFPEVPHRLQQVDVTTVKESLLALRSGAGDVPEMNDADLVPAPQKT